MRIREVAGVAGAGVAVLGIAACSAPEPALGGTTDDLLAAQQVLAHALLTSAP